MSNMVFYKPENLFLLTVINNNFQEYSVYLGTRFPCRYVVSRYEQEQPTLDKTTLKVGNGDEWIV